jgi:hypothetical protein
MKECEWKERRKTLNYLSKISPLLFKHKLGENQMMKVLEKNILYGFWMVDIEPLPEANKFLHLNWPPILKKMDVHADQLPDWMHVNKKSFPRQTVVQTMRATEILLHSELLNFYLTNGFQVTKIHKFYEYEGRKCLLPVHDAIYNARVAATIENDNCRATAVKLTSNAMYGQTLMVSFTIRSSYRNPTTLNRSILFNKTDR